MAKSKLRQLVRFPWAADSCPWVGKLRTVLPLAQGVPISVLYQSISGWYGNQYPEFGPCARSTSFLRITLLAFTCMAKMLPGCGSPWKSPNSNSCRSPLMTPTCKWDFNRALKIQRISTRSLKCNMGLNRVVSMTQAAPHPDELRAVDPRRHNALRVRAAHAVDPLHHQQLLAAELRVHLGDLHVRVVHVVGVKVLGEGGSTRLRATEAMRSGAESLNSGELALV
jgi:hypothetical protein